MKQTIWGKIVNLFRKPVKVQPDWYRVAINMRRNK